MNDGGYDIYTITCNEEVFIYSYNNSLENEDKHIIISRRHHNFDELIAHLENLQGQIGWDNTEYDYQVIHSVILARNSLKMTNPMDICMLLNNISNTVTAEGYSYVKDADYLIPQYDMKSLLGFDKTDWTDVAKRLGLECFDKYDTLDNILKRNVSKVGIIKNIYKICCGCSFLPMYTGQNLLATRQFFFRKYGIRCTNSSNIKLGEQFILKRYRQIEGSIPPPDKTVNYDVKSYLPAFISELTNEDAVSYFNKLKGMQQTNKYPELSGYIRYGNIDLSLTNGSIKGASEPGIYRCNNDELFVYYDITSEFPSIIVNQSLHPQHLSDAFVAATKELLQLRFKAIEDKQEVYVDTIKKMLVGIYGKLGEEKSLLYDKSVQIQVCVYAQAFMCYMIEKIMQIDDSVEFIFVNTDGICFKTNIKNIANMHKMIDGISKDFNFIIKEKTFMDMYLYDVNNYAALSYPDIEVKGIFDARVSLFKNYNQRKSAEIVYAYFIDNVVKCYDPAYTDKQRKLANSVIDKVAHREYTLF